MQRLSRRFRRLLTVAVIVVTVALVWIAATWPVAQESLVGARTAVGNGWLRTSGLQIVDDSGHPVVLHGFNDDTLLESRNGWPSSPAPLDDTDASLMRQAGFTVVRLAVAWSLLEPEEGSISAAYVAKIVNTVRLLERHGLRTIIDMHIGLAWGVNSNVPAWAHVSGVPDWRPVSTGPLMELARTGALADEAHFWTTDEWKQQLAFAWTHIASQFTQDPMVFAYDLFNEPHPWPIPPQLFETRFMWPTYAELISAVARVDPNHIFMVDGMEFEFGGITNAIEPIHARNVVYAPHIYAGSIAPIPFMDTGQAVDYAVQNRLHEAQELGFPLFIGEMGTGDGSKDSALYTSHVLADLSRAGVGWAWWQWRQDDGWGIRSVDGTRINRSLLSSLSRAASL